MKKAFITGIGGQDGSFLTEFLLSKGYEVHGLIRRVSSGYNNLRNLIHLVRDENIYRKKLFLHSGDLGDASSLQRIIKEVGPDEIYNLAAQADVMESFLMPEYSTETNGTAVIRLLEIVKQEKPNARFYQASTSELFGKVEETPQNENTRFNPQSPYAIGKYVGFQSVKKYREMYGIFACNGILFNHASERRGDDYLDRKVTKAAARIKLGLQKELRLGNLEAKRDWGYAKEYVEAMWAMLQKNKPDDYVIGTGETHTVEEWVNEAFNLVNLNWKDYVISDPSLYRPAEVDILRADNTKARQELNFEPKTRFKELIAIMVQHDLDEQRKLANLS